MLTSAGMDTKPTHDSESESDSKGISPAGCGSEEEGTEEEGTEEGGTEEEGTGILISESRMTDD